MKMSSWSRSAMLSVAAMAALATASRPAQACGGFFCSSPTLPINQAAERIIFSSNGDGTVTAVIQIAYEGPAPNFSWLLPISSVPQQGQIGVSSNLAFQRLQTATNPRYNLTVRVEGTCARSGFADAGSARDSAIAVPTAMAGGGNVTVESSGTVGAFNYAVISVNSSAPDRSEAAVTWLTANGYSVDPGAPGLIRPYLQDGLHLLALKLTKGADTGSIRPISVTYNGTSPMIPIKLTAVAANDDMGVMTWLLGSARGVPQNYMALELNEARINWFNPSSNYNDVVTAAANEGTGQGFVTEFAGRATTLASVVWSNLDEAQWQDTQAAVYPSLQTLFDTVHTRYRQWDGFWDAARDTIALPSGVPFADFRSCPTCYDIQFSPSALFAALQTNVIQPVKAVQALLDRNAYVTRLYTTMSAGEMTADPLFTFNADLPDVSNVHTAERVIECSPEFSQFDAPWRIVLPNGGVVRGKGNPAATWPADFNGLPSNSRILRFAASGLGAVLEDNAPTIDVALQSYNARMGTNADAGSGGMSADAGVSDAAGQTPHDATGATPAADSGPETARDASAGSAADAGAIQAGEPRDEGAGAATRADAEAGSGSTGMPEVSGGGGCSTGAGPATAPGWLLAALSGAAWVGRRRRRA